MKGKPGKSKDALDGTVPNVRTLKSAQCKSLSGRSTLTYEVGATGDGEIHLRIRSNSGSGCFGRDWVPLRELQQALAKAPGPVTSGSLHRVFAGRSQNTSGFVAAALLGEGLLEPLSNARGYAPTDGVGFMREVRRLLEGGPSATVASVVAKKAAAAKAPTQQTAAKPQKADAAMPAERKAKAPSKTKKARR
jgi:hypothetical protein